MSFSSVIGNGRFRFRIVHKIAAIGACSALALSILMAIIFFSSLYAGRMAEVREVRLTQLDTVVEMRTQTGELLLAAMDSIIDKDEGKIQPERKQVMGKASEFLKRGAGQLADIADTEEERKLADTIRQQIESLSKAIYEDLGQAIEAKSSQADFAKIDDVIDNNGEALVENLNKFRASIKSELGEATLAAANATSLTNTLGWVTFISALIGMSVLIALVGRSITRPLSSLNVVMQQLAKGDKSVVVPAVDRTDELGEMAATVEFFKTSMIENDRLQAEQREAEAARTAEKAMEREKAEEERRIADEKAQREKKQALQGLADTFEAEIQRMVEEVGRSAGNLRSNAEVMSQSAEEATTQAGNVASASEVTAGNVQTVASAAEELSASITEISEQVSQASRITQSAVQVTESTNEKVKSLDEAAQKIGEVVNLINDIANQTNLLALNATIEAARAGEAGKGFSVVATEVKSLANQTGAATDQIAKQIQAIQAATQEAVQAIREITRTIGEIDGIATTVAAAVEEQGAATQEIAGNVQKTASGTTEVNENITGVSQSIGNVGKVAGEVLTSAGTLQGLSQDLLAKVEGFLKNVRAA